ncbi:hypothetical protein JCM10207_001882 [Rhodosporidiobolus poonsookiae]
MPPRKVPSKADKGAQPASALSAKSEDRLTALPTELIDHIFDLCDGERPRGPICKALLPIYRRRYRSLEFIYDRNTFELKYYSTCKPAHSRGDNAYETHFVEVAAKSPNLERLDLKGIRSPLAVLGALASPSRLVELDLSLDNTTAPHWRSSKNGGQDDNDSQSAAASYSAALSRLTGLKTLFVEGCSLDAMKGLLPVLAKLPLEHLTFGDSPLGADHFLEVLANRQWLRQLKRISFDNIHADEGAFWDDFDGSRDEFEETWHRPTWSRNFTLEGLDRIIDEASERGVEVNGEVFKALEVDEMYEEEIMSFGQNMW